MCMRGGVHSDLPVAVGELEAVQRVVEVARRLGVNRTDRQMPQVCAHVSTEHSSHVGSKDEIMKRKLWSI